MAAELRVLLVGNYAGDRQHSMLGFGDALSQALPSRKIQVKTIAPRRVLPSPAPRLRKWAAYADKYVLFPRALRKTARGADVVHVLDQGNGIYVGHLRSVPHLVTIHDLLAIRGALGELSYWTTGASGRVYQNAILRGLRKSNFVACVSTATLCDARRLLSLPAERLAMLPNDLFTAWTPRVGEPAPTACRAADLDAGTKFFLHIGDASPYKNRMGALKVFAALAESGEDARFVLAGKPLSEAERAQIQTGGFANRFIEFSEASREDLEWLYGNAAALVMTSHDEGFGLPILEGQACGCPVFIPDKEPMTEVAGGAAITIDPAEPKAAAASIVDGLRNLGDLKARGYTNAAKYRAGTMVVAYANLYRELAARRPG